MRRLTILAAFSLLSVLGLACGKPFTAAVGGGGSGGAGASGGGGGTPSTDSGTGGCNPNVAFACAAGEYCKTDDCVDGVCTPEPGGAEVTKWDPVCGCNGIAYWNRALALQGGAAYRQGTCDLDSPPTPMTECYVGNAGVCQTQGAGCYLHSELACTDTPTGVCLVVPDGCTGVTDLTARNCAEPTAGCQSLCDIIKGAHRWHVPAQSGCTPP